MSETILVVDDEKDIVKAVEYSLRREGYQTRSAFSGLDGLAATRRDPRPDLVILDLMLPDLPGVEVCKQIRADARLKGIPVLMLTARSEEIDRIVGFEVGADDYLVKPFSMRELLLRVRAILKRVHPRQSEPEEIVFGALKIDAPAHRAWVKGEEIVLTALEFKLLVTLVERRGRVQTRESLLADVWDILADVTTRTVDTHVKRLREKLGLAGAYIETVRGVGYRFRAEPDEGDE